MTLTVKSLYGLYAVMVAAGLIFVGWSILIYPLQATQSTQKSKFEESQLSQTLVVSSHIDTDMANWHPSILVESAKVGPICTSMDVELSSYS